MSRFACRSLILVINLTSQPRLLKTSPKLISVGVPKALSKSSTVDCYKRLKTPPPSLSFTINVISGCISVIGITKLERS